MQLEVREWRACARCTIHGISEQQRGEWRTHDGARKQADRWAHDPSYHTVLVWLECVDGAGLEVIAQAPGMGDPDPYIPGAE